MIVTAGPHCHICRVSGGDWWLLETVSSLTCVSSLSASPRQHEVTTFRPSYGRPSVVMGGEKEVPGPSQEREAREWFENVVGWCW